jgi:hypothetical protein
MALTAPQKAILQKVLDYQNGNYEKPLDQLSIELLTPLASTAGYTDQIKFQTDLLNKPFSVLIAWLKLVS